MTPRSALLTTCLAAACTSAGGDGVYQIAPRRADRWAAANMAAGHPDKVSLVNLYHVPFAIQVGEVDIAYVRNLDRSSQGSWRLGGTMAAGLHTS